MTARRPRRRSTATAEAPVGGVAGWCLWRGKLHGRLYTTAMEFPDMSLYYLVATREVTTGQSLHARRYTAY